MSTQHFVYGEFGTPDEATRAVGALVDGSFDPDEIDVLSVPSPYREPKGMYLLEAMACGVPVVQPDYGAFPEMIQRTGGGVLARSERPGDIADQLHALWRDPAGAAALGERGAQGVRDHYSVDHMTDRMLEVYRELVDNRAGRIPAHQELSVARR